MGKWLNFIKNGFKHTLSSTDTSTTSALISVPNDSTIPLSTPIPAPSISTFPLSIPDNSAVSTTTLLPLAEQMSTLSIFEPISNKLLMHMNNGSSISLKDLQLFLSEGDALLTEHTQSSTTYPPYQQYITLVEEMMRLDPLDASLTHENLAQSNLTSILQKLTNYYTILEKLLPSTASSTTLESFNKITEPLTTISTNFNDLITFFKSFKSREATLRQEIEAYSQALSQIHNQNGGVNIDWGDKRGAFEQKNAELTKRRAAYDEEEKLINQKISILSTQLNEVISAFYAFLSLFKEDLVQRLHNSPVLITQKQLDVYKALREQMLSLFPVV